MNYLKFDVFAKRVGFFFNKQEKIGSYFGLLLTLLYAIISIILFIYNIISAFKREEIKVYDSTLYAQEMPIIDLDRSSFYFAFGLEDPETSNRFIDETIYYPEVLFIDRIKIDGNFKTIINKKLSIEKCKEENFGQNYQHLFIKGELLNSYCLKDFDYNITFSGGYKYERLSYIRLKIFQCKNTTENNNHCKSQEIIDKYFTSGYFSILLKDIGLNPSNYSDPTIPTLQDLFTTVDKRLYRTFILNFGLTEIHTDTGLLNENIRKDKHIQFRKDLQTFSFREPDDFNTEKEFCLVQMRLDDTILVQKRAYTKISEILSRIGGYMQLMYTVFLLISLLINKIDSEIKIVNKLFNYDFDKNKIFLKYNTFQSLKTITIPNDTIPRKLMNNKTSNYEFSKSNNNLILRNNSIFSFNVNESSKIKKNNSDLNNNIASPHFNTKNKSFGSKINLYKEDNKKIEDRLIVNIKKHKSEVMEFKDHIDLNIFDLLCIGKNIHKRRIIDLFHLGKDFYRKRMDLVLVFSHLLLTEKMLLKNYQDLNSLYTEIKI
jgi:hypothetical protein